MTKVVSYPRLSRACRRNGTAYFFALPLGFGFAAFAFGLAGLAFGEPAFAFGFGAAALTGGFTAALTGGLTSDFPTGALAFAATGGATGAALPMAAFAWAAEIFAA